MNKNRAFITGITGMDGSYLAEFLLEKGYEVGGLVRRTSTPSNSRIEHLEGLVTLLDGDLLDEDSIGSALCQIEPTEVYNLGAQSFVGTSWTQPVLTSEVTGLGTLRLLNQVRLCCSEAKFYQASSSEQFGKVRETPQNENTPFHPRSPYGVAKCFAHYIAVNYRESYDLHTSCGILFNHESPRRGNEFVTQKVARAAAAIKRSRANSLSLGNLDAQRDWGHAKDYIEAMWLMTQQKEPDDYVIATGETHSIRDLLDVAFEFVDLDWREYVKVDEAFIRPAEVDLLIGNSSKAREKLRWQPRYSFRTMVEEMVWSALS